MSSDVTFSAPAIGNTVVPIGLAGPGTVDWDGEGITLTGPMHSKNATSVLGCFGFIISFALAIAVMMALKLNASDLGGELALGLALGGTVAFITVGRKIFPPKVKTFRFAWADVKKLGREGASITFVTKSKPKGQVWFQPGVIPEGLEGVDRALAMKDHPGFHETVLQAGKAGGAQML